MTLSIPSRGVEASVRVRAPTQAEWDAMTEPERAAVVNSLPSWVDIEESSAIQGDEHRTASPASRRRRAAGHGRGPRPSNSRGCGK